MNPIPKYSKLEIERKWLVGTDCDQIHKAKESWVIADLYLSCGLLRLRRQISNLSGEVILKIAKKYPSESAVSRPMTNLYLSVEEFAALESLPSHAIHKTRYHVQFGNHTWAIDVFEGKLIGLVLAELELDDLTELMAIQSPDWVICDVTNDLFFSGGQLSRIESGDLQARLASFEI